MTEKECRICFEKDKTDEFINPCLCDGTSKWVHKSCLNEWRETNIDKPANTNCMECKYKYKFNYIYPEEVSLFEKSFISKHRIYYLILLYFILLPFSYLFYFVDKNNDYLYLKMISCYDEKVLNETKLIINQDTLYRSVFYETLVLTIYANIYMVLFFIYTTLKKERKNIYLKLFYKNLICIFFSINNPFYVYYLFSFFQMYFIYIISQCIFSFHTSVMTIDIIRIHNKIVNKMNSKFNKKIILNYENNSETKSDDLLINENIILQTMA